MYESTPSTVTEALQTSSNPTFSDAAAIKEIISLTTSNTGGVSDTTVTFSEVIVTQGVETTVPAGTEVMLLSATQPTGSTAPVVLPASATKNVPVVVIQGNANIDLTLNDGTVQGADAVTTSTGATTPATGTQRVVVAGSGETKVTIADAKNTKLTLGTGNSTVVTGHGTDTVVAGLGNSTITGGASDYSVVKLAGAASNYTVAATNGHAVVTDKITGKTTDISKIQFVEVGGGDALIFAKNATEASIASLFEVAFGRNADAAGLDYYYDLAKDGATLNQIANALVKSAEFGPRSLLDDTAFINSLYQNTFGRNAEAAGQAYWLDAMQNHGIARADVIRSFAEIHTLNLQGTNAPGATALEATLVGNVTIVAGII
ncbi:MAG: DUF4214 domain-containing protein [Burkholderiaceae bacterium]|nr:DUF4214 domain-containing protein [Burkholderiaceae bacterium]